MKFHTKKLVHARGALTISADEDFSDDKVVSCGIEGLVAVWDRDAICSDGTPFKREISDRTHSCCTKYGSQIYAGFTQTDLSTGVEKQVVGSFSSENESDAVKTLLSFSLDVTCIRVSKDWVIAGSSDFSVKRAERLDTSSGYIRYELNSQILDIQICPTDKLFAASSCDGLVTLFAGDDTEPISTHKMFSPIRDLDDSLPRVIMAWSRDGQFLFVPSKGMVKVLGKKGGKWSIEREFMHDDNKDDDFSVLTISRCGKYLAASTMSSLIHIWEIESGLLMSTADYGAERVGRITCLAYMKEKLVLADSHGNITAVEEAGPSKTKMEEKKNNVFVEDEAMLEDSLGGKDDDDDEDEEDEDDLMINKTKKFIVDDDEEIEENTNMSSSIAAIKKKYGYDDDGQRLDAPEGDSFDEDPFSNIDAHESTRKSEKREKPVAPVTVVQKYSPPVPPSYFASASSPRTLTQRYLKWNGFGTIRVLESEDGDSSLEVRFHDSSVHSEILLSNSDFSYSMGDLNDKVVALATRVKSASKHLYVKLLSSWDSTDDHWDMEMSKGEMPEDVVVSSHFIALLCENRNIRVFTHAGTQRHVITHPTPILSMAAYMDRLAVVSIAGGPLFLSAKDDNDYEFPLALNEYRLGATQQWWSSTAMTAVGNKSPLVRDQPLALSKGTNLTWIGYTNRGRIVAQGSDSVIRLLVTSSHSPPFWTPIFDGADDLTSSSDAIWPISVVEKPIMQLRYVYCRGVKYPMVTLKLTPIVANWSLPLCNKSSDKTSMEEELFMNELALSASGDAFEIKELSSNHLKTIIKLFSLAVKADRESRAVEMANLTTSSKGVQLLVNWAAKQRRNALVEKVSEVGRRKAEEEEEAANGWEERERRGESGGETSARVLPKMVPLRRSIAAVAASRYRMSEEKEEQSTTGAEESPSEPPSSQGVFDTSISASRNPFKRSLDDSLADTSSTSVFDDLDSPAPLRKKLKEKENTAPVPSIALKQAKINFGGSGKKTSGYDLWLVENEEKLKGDFVGGEEDFSKYCTQAYRMLSAADRKEWRTKAEST